MLAVAVIPARLGSTRFPHKVLADLNGRPLLWHVWSRVSRAEKLAAVYIATDAAEIQNAAQSWGASTLLTREGCESGTERIASVLDRIPGDLVINVQADEPLIDPGIVDALVNRARSSEIEIVTPVYRLGSITDLTDPNVVKVARAADGRALYFSRHPIPYLRDVPMDRWIEQAAYWGHVGVYAYSRSALTSYMNSPPSALECSERLEQLRYLEAGHIVQTVETYYRPIAVDTPEDLLRVRALVAACAH